MKDMIKIAKEKALSDGTLLYHYCSVASFFSIMKNQSIWLSDISKSNDSQELKWFLLKFETFMHRLLDSQVREKAQGGYNDDPVEIQDLYSKVVQALQNESIKCWAFCLSEKRDDLGQWRGYADDGKGLAIGFNQVPFNASNMEKIMNLGRNDIESFLSPRFVKVEYGETGLPCFELPNSEGFDLSKETSLSVIRDKLIDRVNLIKRVAPFYKNDGFIEEGEWRFVYTEECNKINQEDFKEIEKVGEPVMMPIFRPAKWGYIEKDGDLVSHIECQSERFEDTISDIIIGPKCKLTETEIKLFLVSCGLFTSIEDCDIRISKSASSYQ